MEVEGGDGIKGLTRLGWHMLLRQAVQPGLSGHSIVRHVCVNVRDGNADTPVGFVCLSWI